jgi:hypothetical protein
VVVVGAHVAGEYAVIPRVYGRMASDVSFGPQNGFVSAAPHRALLSRQRALRACVWGFGVKDVCRCAAWFACSRSSGRYKSQFDCEHSPARWCMHSIACSASWIPISSARIQWLSCAILRVRACGQQLVSWGAGHTLGCAAFELLKQHDFRSYFSRMALGM